MSFQVPMLTVDFFTAVTTMGSNLYSNIMHVLIIVGVLAFLVALFGYMLTHDDKKVAFFKGTMFRVILCIIIACILGTIVTYLIALTNGYKFDVNQTAGTVLPAFGYLFSA